MRLWRRASPPSKKGLPEGLWRDDFARIDRACQRFVQVSRDDADWAAVRETLVSVRAQAWQLCVEAAAVDPRPGAEVPGDAALANLHRGLTRAAVRCAQAAEAVVMAQPVAGRVDPAPAARAADQALAGLRSLPTTAG